MNFWPFVSKARYADRIAEIAELKKELGEARRAYARVVDRINFRSTGWHIDETFAAEDTREPEEVKESAPAKQASGLEELLAQGGNMTARRRAMEMASVSKAQEAEREAREGRERMLQAQAANRMEEILQRNTPPQA